MDFYVGCLDVGYSLSDISNYIYMYYHVGFEVGILTYVFQNRYDTLTKDGHLDM